MYVGATGSSLICWMRPGMSQFCQPATNLPPAIRKHANAGCVEVFTKLSERNVGSFDAEE